MKTVEKYDCEKCKHYVYTGRQPFAFKVCDLEDCEFEETEEIEDGNS